MKDNIVSLQKYKEDKEPKTIGIAKCMNCKHEWDAIVPCATDNFLECPSCGTCKGVFKYPYSYRLPTWTCNCGNDLMRITPEGGYCVNCGNWKT